MQRLMNTIRLALHMMADLKIDDKLNECNTLLGKLHMSPGMICRRASGHHNTNRTRNLPIGCSSSLHVRQRRPGDVSK
jgi:hypothetical protein